MKLRSSLLVLQGVVLAGAAYAQAPKAAAPAAAAAPVVPAEVSTEEGVLKTLGTSYERIVTLTESSSAKAKNGEVPLCDGELATRLNKITSMTVQVKGSWVDKKNKKGKVTRTCFDGTEFTITKTPSGTPLVGELTAKGEVYAIKTDAGQEHNLETVSPGLAKLVGKKLIIDAREAVQKTDKVWTVVTYSLYP